MKFVIDKKYSCNFETGNECDKGIIKKIESKLKGNTDKINFHISIRHSMPNHRIWVFLYDEDNKHESESHGKTVYTQSNTVKKFKGTKPTESEIKKIL